MATRSAALRPDRGAQRATPRGKDAVTAFFDGLDLVPPGVVTTSRWRPDLADASAEAREVDAICGVGRKD